MVVGSGRLVTKEMDFSDFTVVEAGNAFEVKITRSDSYSVSITADDNLFDYIKVSKADDRLRIGLKPGYSYRSAILKARIAMPDLYGLSFSGATRGTVEGFSSSHGLSLDMSGASSVKFADTSVGTVEADLSGGSRVTGVLKADGEARFAPSGASKVELKGRANDLRIEASGASYLEMPEFLVHNAKIELSGASQANINLDGRLDAHLSGASGLRYIGEPTMGDVRTSGASRIRRA